MYAGCGAEEVARWLTTFTGRLTFFESRGYSLLRRLRVLNGRARPARTNPAHNAGRGARYTSGRRPVWLVYAESFDTLSAALQREYELKQWPRWKKQTLVASARRRLATGKMDIATE